MMDPRASYLYGLRLTESFRRWHELPPVQYSTRGMRDAGRYVAACQRDGAAATISVDLSRASDPCRTLAHEMGHHVWRFFMENFPDDADEYAHCWTPVVDTYEQPICKAREWSPEERFCEAVAAFILQPDWLAAERPHRFGLLVHIGLEAAS